MKIKIYIDAINDELEIDVTEDISKGLCFLTAVLEDDDDDEEVSLVNLHIGGKEIYASGLV